MIEEEMDSSIIMRGLDVGKKISLKMCSDIETNFLGKKLSCHPWRYLKKSIDAALRDLV